MTAQELLKTHFGYDSFRNGQQQLVNAILSGQDVLGIMPTGAGKSICFQLPALMLPGITLVVSPLISLMKDQVGALIQSGVAGAYLNSSLSPRQMDLALYNARQGKYKIIYVAPERLLSPDFLDFCSAVTISMLAVDEAHCISQWGQDFRPSYAQIPQFVAALPTRPVVAAFTATATQRVRQDILQLLALESPQVLVTGFDRENLYFEVQAPRNKLDALTAFLKKNPDKSGIVYCSTRKAVEEVCAALNQQGLSATRYHAGLPDGERHANQDDFLYDRAQLMIATNAFGMGIDKSNVAFVVHYNMPKDLESYYQEAGRAGRDGSNAHCLLLYSGQDVRTNQWMIEHSKELLELDAPTEQQLKARDHQRLRDMTFYCTTNDCLRAYILRYFGEAPAPYCGQCSNCNTKFQLVDVTQEARQLLQVVLATGQRFGAGMLVDLLRGSKNERLLTFGFDSLPLYGASTKSVHTLRAVLEQLVQQGYLIKADGQYATLSLAEKAEGLLEGEETLEMKLAQEREKAAPKASPTPRPGKAQLAPQHEGLYQQLRTLRASLAKRQGVPAYAVFTDQTLVEMCAHLPQSEVEFRLIPGVGEAKLRRYGQTFLAQISAWQAEN